MIEVREYVDAEGNNPFRKWLDRLDRKALAKVEASGSRMELGNFGDVEPVGEGVSEHRIHFGPGYRIYFGRDGEHLVILLAGGTKRRQSRDIAAARARWRDYKQRKREKG